MSNQQTAYVVTEGSYSDYHIVRVYLDGDEAQRFVDAYNDTLTRRYKFTCNGYFIEEFTIGGDRAEMDGPIWEGRCECTNESVDSFDVHEIWHTGPTPPLAEVTYANGLYATVRGTSKEHVEKSLHDTAARLKAEHTGIA